MFLHCNIHKYTWASADGTAHNQIDHILTDRRWHLNILDALSVRGADLILISDHLWWLQKVRESLALSKQASAAKFDGESFNLQKLNKLEFRKEYLSKSNFYSRRN
jgi:hypothetical protein